MQYHTLQPMSAHGSDAVPLPWGYIPTPQGPTATLVQHQSNDGELGALREPRAQAELILEALRESNEQPQTQRPRMTSKYFVLLKTRLSTFR